MRDFLNDNIKNIKPSGIRRFFDIANEMEDVISLGVGEPDFATPMNVRDAAVNALYQGQTYYTANAGLFELREAIAQKMAQDYELTYDPKTDILVTVGGSEAIDVALRATINPGDEVIYLDPYYVSYLPCIQLAGGTPVPIALQEENRFRLTPEELEAAITDKTKAIIMNYPNNPTGAIMEKADNEAIAEVIIKHDLLVITDEIYADLTYTDEPHHTIASLPGMQERTIYINGFSKAYAMTGWRLGYCCGPTEIMEAIIKIHQFVIMAAPTISQFAGLEALRESDEDVQIMRKSYNQRRRYMLAELTRLGFKCFEPLGAFYVFPNITQFGMTSEEFATQLIMEERLAVVPGTAFGESGEGFVRISYAYSIRELQQAIKRLESFVTRFRAEK